MKVVAVFLAVACLASFSWGRRAFFRKTSETRPGRGGLGPIGTIWGISSLSLIVFFDTQENPLLSWVAIGGFCFSILLFWAAVRSFQDARPAIASSAEVPAALITSGPYRVVRHPFYLAYMLYWFSVPIWLQHSVFAAPALALFFIYYKTAREEESAILESDLKADYRIYKYKAGMFFPRIF